MVAVQTYLDRIGYAGSTTPAVDTLRAIHHAHLMTVPFENLDIALGRKIVVDEDVTVRKVVELRRGGFCYELNGAFAALLRALGFQVTLLSARVSRERGGEGREFDHLTLRVDLEEPWLADVGFGESFLEPLRLEVGRKQVDPAGTFLLVQLGERLQLEKAEPADRWKRQYSFSLVPRQLKDFAGMCHYHQTSPESHFTQNSICTRATPDGRVTLAGMKWIVTRGGQREERMLDSEEERSNVLRNHFGITL
ncbi:MAG TPA: arylamine N-acetyltransferase [Candidatus Sulfotelmatobacter sp.]|nr:arylamine N-acetyltransferase [Candidatus Sulfotelmatobacter sp.]